MRTLIRLTLGGLLFITVAGGCDSVGPDGGGDATARGALSVGAINGSVFVNDGDDKDTVREPGELGIQNVRVDVYAPNAATPTASVLTGPDGKYAVNVPSGTWVVRVTPVASAGAFNPTLFDFYEAVAGLTERTVHADPRVHHVDFGFDPVLTEILTEVAHGDAQTEGRIGSRWLRWLRLFQDGHQCIRADGERLCRTDVDGYLDDIFDDGTPNDNFFGNAEPYTLPAGADPLDEAVRILDSRPNTDLGRIRVELFLAELNFHAGFGSPDPTFDTTLLSFYEGYLAVNEAAQNLRAREKVLSVELNVLRAYNRGGGGGGEGGDN